MQLHTLTAPSKTKRAQRIGRGGKRGSFSGRGIKGQKARAGRRIRPEMRDLIMKMPKRRGYKHTGPKDSFAIIDGAVIAKKFKAGDKVTPKILVTKRLVKRIGGKVPSVKILNKKALPQNILLSGFQSK